MSGAIRIAPAPGRCRAARHAVFAAIGARPAGRHSAHSRARRCRACTIRSAGWPSAPRLAQARRSERLPSAAGLRRARRIAGVTASWRRCAKRRTGLPGSSRRTRPSFSRAGRGSGSWIASRARRGGKARKRGLSREQVPILVAADRAGATLSHTLPALNAKSVKEALEPVVARDALLVSDANRCYPPVAAALGIPHESINGARRRAGSRRPAHPDGQQPPQPDQGLPAGLPRHRHQVPRQLSQVVPSHRTRRSAIAHSVSRGGDGQTMPTFR